MKSIRYRITARVNEGLSRAPILPLPACLRLFPRDVVGFCYHVVSDERLEHADSLYAYKPVEVFEQHLLYLKERFQVLSYEEISARRRSGKPGSSPGVFVSFDDGMAECYSVVRPLLKKHNIPCIFFLTTDFLDNASMFHRHQVSICLERLKKMDEEQVAVIAKQMNDTFQQTLLTELDVRRWILALEASESGVLDELCSLFKIDIRAYLRDHRPYVTCDQVRELVSDGFTIGAHSKSHPVLGIVSEQQREEEIIDSTMIVKELAGAPSVPFAFPYSGDGIDRGHLRRIKAMCEHLDMYFDLNGWETDIDCVVNRVWTEHRLVSPSPNTGMRAIIRNTCQNYVVNRILPIR